MRRLLFSITTLALASLLGASPAVAQVQSYEPNTEIKQQRPVAPAQGPTTPEVAAEDAMQLRVRVLHGATSKPVPEAAVFLRAARPRGPFEPTAPTPRFEWTGFTDANGVATFDEVPADLPAQGLRVHAAATYAGIAFESAAITPAAGATLDLKVYEKGLDTRGVKIANLRNIIDIWEGYLVFTQFYTLRYDGETALDVSLLPGEEYERGLPFELPVKAQGIQVTGPGETAVVNSTLYWKGVLKPGDSVNLQVRFSLSAKEPEFTYEQQVDYPTENVEVVVPVQTRYKKLPRLDDIELRPPGFAETDRGAGLFGLRQDFDFIGARGLKLESGESFRFQLRGLPFEEPILPWVFFGLGIGFAGLILVYARHDQKRRETSLGKKEVVDGLQRERESLLEELVALEQDYRDGHATAREYEIESSSLRERLALVMKKLQDLGQS